MRTDARARRLVKDAVRLSRGEAFSPRDSLESQAFAVRLFREATQLKTVTTIARIRRMHARRTEHQTPGISAVANSRSCPENSSITGLIQCTRIMIAAARGGAARHSNRAACASSPTGFGLRYLISVQAAEACGVWGRGWQQKTLCVPPRREASARATLWVAEARLKAPPQFSAPCQPHCGSAFAPPRFTVARWDFISILLTAK